MVEPTAAAQNKSQQRNFTQVTSSSRLSAWRGYVFKRRWLLGTIALVLILLMVGGILVAAHQGYIRMGGQGWLKVRSAEQDLGALNIPEVFLPFRKVSSGDETSFEKRNLGPIPYYHCGDQMQSCEAYGQPVSHPHPKKLRCLTRYRTSAALSVPCAITLRPHYPKSSVATPPRRPRSVARPTFTKPSAYHITSNAQQS